jgi:medium-chain acyl-[acyl-carrier-protein] hydrolase
MTPARRLLLLPPAGAGTIFWKTFEPFLTLHFGEVLALRGLGREGRCLERSPPSMRALVGLLLDELPDDGAALTIFGHSMGAFVGLEVCRQLEERQRSAPQHLVVSGHVGPPRHVPVPLFSLSRQRLREFIRDLGGTPEAVLEDAELWGVIEPTLREDMRILNEYVPPTQYQVRCPLTAMSGSEDRAATPDAVQAWAASAEVGFRHLRFKGGHFFILRHVRAVSEALLWSPPSRETTTISYET